MEKLNIFDNNEYNVFSKKIHLIDYDRIISKLSSKEYAEKIILDLESNEELMSEFNNILRQRKIYRIKNNS